MTLQNGLTLGDRAFLWSDTAYTDTATGKVAFFQNKIFATEVGVPAAVSMTTIGGDPMTIMEFVAKHGLIYFKIGDLLEACELAARAFVADKPQERVCRLLVAGWCYETDSARLFLITSQEVGAARPFGAVELEHSVNTGNGLDAYHHAVALGLRLEHMPYIIEAQRAAQIDPEFDGIEPYHGIGGNVLEAEITETGVVTRVVREWGDRVGERIAA